MDAARRELREETGLENGLWHPHPFTTADAIYTDEQGRTEFHYLIAGTPFCALERSTSGSRRRCQREARWWSRMDVERMDDVSGDVRARLAEGRSACRGGIALTAAGCC